MKKILIALMAGMMLAATMPATATRHYAGKQTTAATAGCKNAHDASGKYKARKDSAMAVVAYSDTTDTDAADADIAENDSTDLAALWQSQKEMRGMMNEALMPIAVVFIIFFMAPVVIIGLIVYLIIKSRNQKLRLAELAIQSGQPIPEFIKKKEEESPETKGIKCMFIGCGLFIALLIMGLKSISGFGLLVMFIGCGQFVIANWPRWTNKNNNGNSTDGSNKAKDGDNAEDAEDGENAEDGEKIS